MNRSDQLKWLANDVAILESLSGDPKVSLEVPAQYMPDNKPFTISMEGVGGMTGTVRTMLLDTIRGQFNARESEQNATASGKGGAPADGDGRTNAGSRVVTGGGGSTQSFAQGSQESLEDILTRQKEQLDERMERVEWELSSLAAEQRQNTIERKAIERALACIQESQTVSPEPSEESGTTKEKPRRKKG